MKRLLIILSIFIITCTSLGCTDSTANYQNGSTPTEEAPKEELTILDSKLEQEEFGGWIVTGTAQSNTSLDYAEVKVKYYDENGSLVYSDFTNIVDLAANEPWKFKVYGPGSEFKITDYKIAASTTA